MLRSVLADHTVPTEGRPEDDGADAVAVVRRPATRAACVHTDDYGTRSAELVRVPSEPTSHPEVLVAEGPPCTAPFVDVSTVWDDAPVQPLRSTVQPRRKLGHQLIGRDPVQGTGGLRRPRRSWAGLTGRGRDVIRPVLLQAGDELLGLEVGELLPA